MTALPGENPRFVYATQTHHGPQHAENQDSLYAAVVEAWKPGTTTEAEYGLFVIADGVGGLAGGEQASRLAVDTLTRDVLSGLDRETEVRIPDLLENAFQAANAAVIADLPGAASTLSTIMIAENLAYLAHAGDTRIYLIDEGGIDQLTRDHSLVQRLLDLGQITPEEARTHPQRNILYRALGKTDTLEIQVVSHLLLAGATLLLCTDGVWNWVDQNALWDTIRQAGSPQEAADALVHLAVANGSDDDVTAVVVTITR
jgi:serine/threonine protein phosphatase PrpC